MLQDLMNIKLSNLTQEMVQASINEESKSHSPKTIRNINGLLSAVLSEYHPGFILKTVLPKQKKTELYIPTEKEVNIIIKAAEGTPLEIPILLAACLGLRRSEIIGLTWDCYNDKIITVKKAMVLGSDNKWAIKEPKSFAGKRSLEIPSFIAEKLDALPRNSEHIVTLTGTALSKRFERLLERCGIKKFRFHDLRHYNASIMLALNVPNPILSARTQIA